MQPASGGRPNRSSVHREGDRTQGFEPGENTAILTFLTPGLRFYQDGQFEGRQVHLSPHLGRAPDEPVDTVPGDFYHRMLDILKRPLFRNGQWPLLDCAASWNGNWTNECFIAYRWMSGGGPQAIVVVNYAGHQCQRYVKLARPGLYESRLETDRPVCRDEYERKGSELAAIGLYIDAAPWKASVFWMDPLNESARS